MSATNRLKFRAKWLLSFADMKANDWVHAGIGEEYSLRGFFADIDRKRLDPETVGQWTGAESNCYADDRVIATGHGGQKVVGVIVFDDEQSGFMIVTDDDYKNYYPLSDFTDFQIIGNIHDKAGTNET